jgi:hypothetical protein
MLRKAAAGLAGLGLIGGAGNVIYNSNGDATVKIKDANGHVQSVTIAGGGAAYSCPDGTHDKLASYDIRLGRIELTLRQVRRGEQTIEKQYPKRAPHRVVVRYKGLVQRERKLVDAYNVQVDARNAILDADCTATND